MKKIVLIDLVGAVSFSSIYFESEFLVAGPDFVCLIHFSFFLDF
jgi:hypothetical protein